MILGLIYRSLETYFIYAEVLTVQKFEIGVVRLWYVKRQTIMG